MTDILNLTFYKAIEVRENENDYLVFASSTVPPTCCPKCQSLEFNKHGTREPTFMDIPTHGKRLGIRVIRQRYRCKHCALYDDASPSVCRDCPGVDLLKRISTKIKEIVK